MVAVAPCVKDNLTILYFALFIQKELYLFTWLPKSIQRSTIEHYINFASCSINTIASWSSYDVRTTNFLAKSQRLSIGHFEIVYWKLASFLRRGHSPLCSGRVVIFGKQRQLFCFSASYLPLKGMLPFQELGSIPRLSSSSTTAAATGLTFSIEGA